jgi:fatty acid-binding protein DegV
VHGNEAVPFRQHFRVERHSEPAALRAILNFTRGTDVMILKIFSQKNSAKKLAFLIQNYAKAKLCKILIITSVFEKNAIFSPKIVENRRKL